MPPPPGRLAPALALLLAACAGAPPSPTAPVAPRPSPSVASPSATPRPSPRPGTVDVGDGRLISITCRGEGPPGTPTVVLEQGLGGSTTNWSSIRRAIEPMARVCAYDRAGLGASDPPPPGDRTVDDLVDDLEATLAGAGITGPFVFMAHSIGPWVSTVYTSRHPDDVVGLLFIDPRGPGVSAAHLQALGAPKAGEPDIVTTVRADLATGGYDRNEESLRFAPSEAVVAALLDAEGPFFGDRPVTVLHAERTIDQLPPLPEDILETWWDAWIVEQRRYAQESTAGDVIDVPGSGHLVMDDRPRTVIDALAALLERVRDPASDGS